MRDWPPIDEALRARLALSGDALKAEVWDYLKVWPSQEADEAFITRGLTYPWARPAGSFVLEDRDRLGPLTPAHHDELAALAGGVAPGPGEPARYPLLAIGSNGAPDTLIRKFEFLPAADTRVLVVAGRLHDFDVGATAHVAPYGAFPATLVPSPGTAVSCSLLWVTGPQLMALTWSELSYAFGRLAPVRFEPGDPELGEVDHALVYVSRWGHLTIDGQAVSLEAMPAEHRTGAVWSQERLLEHAADRLLGAGTGHRALLELLAREPIPTTQAISEAVAVDATPFAHEAWEPYPGTDPAE